MPETEERALGITECAIALGVSETEIWRRIRSGEILAERVKGTAGETVEVIGRTANSRSSSRLAEIVKYVQKRSDP